MKRNGYTLIEIVVVVASVGMIMTAVVGMILGTFRAQNRTRLDNKITENGSWIINELRRNIFNSVGADVSCAENGMSVEVKNFNDGEITTLSCNSVTNQIASVSATRGNVLLNSSEVTVNSCADFVVCEEGGDSKVTGVTFNFGIGATNSGIGSSRTFTTKVTLRN